MQMDFVWKLMMIAENIKQMDNVLVVIEAMIWLMEYALFLQQIQNHWVMLVATFGIMKPMHANNAHQDGINHQLDVSQ